MPYQVRNVSRSAHTRSVRRRAIGTVRRTLWVGTRRVAPGRRLIISDAEFENAFHQLRTNAARGACEVFEMADGVLSGKVDFSSYAEPEAPAVEEAPEEPHVDEPEEETPDEAEDEGGDDELEEALADLAEGPNEGAFDGDAEPEAEEDPELQETEADAVSEETGTKAYTKAELMGMKKSELQVIYDGLVGGDAGTKNAMANEILAGQE